MKRVISIVLAGLLLSCGANKTNKDKLCGKKWYPTKIESGGKIEQMPAGDKSYFEFKPDGIMIFGGDFVDSNKYSFDEKTNTVTITSPDGSPGMIMVVTKVDNKHLEIKQTLIAMNVSMNISMDTR
jgi:hypothetical protein